jgi:hypothetical protein
LHERDPVHSQLPLRRRLAETEPALATAPLRSIKHHGLKSLDASTHTLNAFTDVSRYSSVTPVSNGTSQ